MGLNVECIKGSESCGTDEFNYSHKVSHFFVVLKRSGKNNWMCYTSGVNTDKECRSLLAPFL